MVGVRLVQKPSGGYAVWFETSGLHHLVSKRLIASAENRRFVFEFELLNENECRDMIPYQTSFFCNFLKQMVAVDGAYDANVCNGDRLMCWCSSREPFLPADDAEPIMITIYARSYNPDSPYYYTHPVFTI